MSKTRVREGFGLVEALVALVVFMIFLAGTLRMFTGSVLANRKAENLRLATYSAQEVVEKARGTPFQQVTQANFPSPFDVKDPAHPNRVVGQGQITIQPYPADAQNPRAKQVIVSTRVGQTRETIARASFRTIVITE